VVSLRVNVAPWVAALALATVVAARATPPTHGVIVGRVTDAKSGAALAYTNIVVEATPRGAVAGADGRFLISEIPIGVYTLVVSRVGHETQRKTDVIVVGEDTTRVDLVLEPALIEANPVVVTAARTEQTARMAPASVSVLRSAAAPTSRAAGSAIASCCSSTVARHSRRIRGGRSGVWFRCRSSITSRW